MKSTNEANSQDEYLGAKVSTDDNYFTVADTTDYFPVLRLDQDHGPTGNALDLCIHLDWAKTEQKKMVDMYRSVYGFPTCANTLKPKFRW